MATDPWAFGWTQILTILGFTLTFIGIRSFGRWKREIVEERRIEIAFEALSVAYKTKFVFQDIRMPLFQSSEWTDMPRRAGETDEEWNRRGPFYTSFKRIQFNKEFFDQVWQLMPKCMTVFGPEIETTFMKLYKARRHIEVSAEMLMDEPMDAEDRRRQDTRDLYKQLRRDHSDHGDFEPEGDRVGRMLREFISELEAKAKPIVDRELTVSGRLLRRFGLQA